MFILSEYVPDKSSNNKSVLIIKQSITVVHG